MVTSMPWLPRIRASMLTAARRGRLGSVSVSRLRRLAIIKGSAAFLAPLIGMVPFKRWPPTMRMRSMALLLPRAPAPVAQSEDPRLRRPRPRQAWANNPISPRGLSSVSPHRHPLRNLPWPWPAPCVSTGWCEAPAPAGHGAYRFPPAFVLACPLAVRSSALHPTRTVFVSCLHLGGWGLSKRNRHTRESGYPVPPAFRNGLMQGLLDFFFLSGTAEQEGRGGGGGARAV